MNMDVNADKNCGWCGGTGWAVPFIGPGPVVCDCILDQIVIRDGNTGEVSTKPSK